MLKLIKNNLDVLVIILTVASAQAALFSISQHTGWSIEAAKFILGQ